MTVEDLLRERGEEITKGVISAEGDMEYWNDGTTTQRKGVGKESAKTKLP